MADFYKGYFDDRYSFAHSDKKWYEKHKDAVSKYNHEYYERHKKKLANDLNNGVKDLSNMPLDELFEYEDSLKAGDMFFYNGEYQIKKNSSPQDKRNDWAFTRSLDEAIELSNKYAVEHTNNVTNAAEKMEKIFNSKGRKPGAIRLQNGRKVSSFENARKANEINYR